MPEIIPNGARVLCRRLAFDTADAMIGGLHIPELAQDRRQLMRAEVVHPGENGAAFHRGQTVYFMTGSATTLYNRGEQVYLIRTDEILAYEPPSFMPDEAQPPVIEVIE